MVGTVPSELLERVSPSGCFSILKLLLFRLRSLKKGIIALNPELYLILGPLRYIEDCSCLELAMRIVFCYMAGGARE